MSSKDQAEVTTEFFYVLAKGDGICYMLGESVPELWDVVLETEILGTGQTKQSLRKEGWQPRAVYVMDASEFHRRGITKHLEVDDKNTITFMGITARRDEWNAVNLYPSANGVKLNSYTGADSQLVLGLLMEAKANTEYTDWRVLAEFHRLWREITKEGK